jgi:tetratricopeptide (TPR) repeat protein/mono/diheme cytochrome c family protein
VVRVKQTGAAVLLIFGTAAACFHLAAQSTPPVTFSEHVAPILFQHCVGCHRPDGDAPFSLLTYTDARQHAAQIAKVTAARDMPPWKPEPGFGDFVGARRLSGSEIDILSKWAASGAVEGDRARLPPAPHWTSGWQSGDPDLIVTFPEYTLRPDGSDVFRNFVLPIPTTGGRYVRALEFRPGNRAVHHANIRIDATPASRRLDDADPAPGYEGLILNSAAYPDGEFLGWTPGQSARVASKGLAWRLPEHADFVVQLHMRPTGKAEAIQPVIGLYFTNDAPPRVPTMLRMGRQNIDIPADDSDYHSIDSYTLPVDVDLLAIQPHSHYRARQMSAWAVLPNHTTESLIKIPRWDFAWQDAYHYTAPIHLPGGTTIFTEYVFDNSARNPRNPDSPPREARWGFRSADEMADVWLQVMTRNENDRRWLAGDFRVKADVEDITGYETQISQNPAYAALHNDVAVLYLEIGQTEGAISHFEAVARLEPRSAVARFNIGTALEAAGRYADAASRYGEAIALDAGYAPAHVNLGTLLLRAGRLSEADAQYRWAIDADPSNAEAHNDLGRVLLATGRRDESIPHLTEALRLRPSYVEAHFNLGEALRNGDQPAAAIAQYQAALDLRPDWAPALTRLSLIFSAHANPDVRKPDDAIRLAARAVDLTRRLDPDALEALASAYASAGRFDEAVTAESAATNLLPSADTARKADSAGRAENYRLHRAYIEVAR